MPRRSSKGKVGRQRRNDGAAGAAPATPAQPTAAGQKNPAAVELGRLGGKKGGLARAAKLTKEQRSEIARKAARARWQAKRG